MASKPREDRMRKFKSTPFLFGLCVFSGCFLLMSVPLWLAVAIGAVTAGFSARSKEPHATALTALALLVGLAGFEAFLRMRDPEERPTYYRPHEMLLAREVDAITNYQPNRRIKNFRMPFGDLGAMSNFAPIREPRNVDFHTDSLGFRNDGDYAGEKLVVLGDSFVVGNGTGQDAILSKTLSRELGIRTYNAAFSTGIEGYVARLEFLRRRFGDGFRAVILIFEGNDLPCEEEDARSRSAEIRGALLGYVPPLVRELESYRLFYGLTRRAVHVLAGDPLVSVRRVGGNVVGFYKKYVEGAKRKRGCEWSAHPAVLGRVAKDVALLAFVPTKYRVYRPLMADQENETALSDVRLAFVERMARDLSVPYLDLTPHLIEASRRLLEEGKYTFWRDDTHWNGHGITAAAKALAAALRSKLPVTPR